MAKRLIPAPEVKPIIIGKFTLTETGAQIAGRPSFGEYAGVLEFARRAHKASGWWVADLLRYGDTRDDWQDKLDAIVDATNFTEGTVKNLKYLGENVAPSRRREDVDISLHMEIAPLPAEEQRSWLEKTATERWTRRELRMNIQASKRRKVIDGQAVLEGTYRVVLADPPWAYNNRGDIRVGKSSAYKRAEAHYPTMTIEQVCALPVAAHTNPNSVLFLWVTSPMLMGNPGPREVIEAWGFEYKSSFVWDKVLGNFGHYNHVCHELLLVCTRGRCLPDRPTPQPKSVITERRSDEHSAKPQSVRTMIERLYDGPYLELFGREPVENWKVFGNDAKLWAAESEAQEVTV